MIVALCVGLTMKVESVSACNTDYLSVCEYFH